MMKKKIWKMVVQKYKDETSIKNTLLQLTSAATCAIAGIIIALIVKIIVL